MSKTEMNLMALGQTVLVWLVKGMCIGAGAWFAWRCCHAC